MEKSYLVSVVIPVYNSEKFLAECIESVLNQTYKNIEIIAINDGSTDDSLKILNQFKDKIMIIHQENQGLAGALNTGIKKMTGKWFKWFSPDDVMYPNAIEILVKKGDEMGDNCIVYSNWEMIDETGKFLRHFSESNYNDLDNFDFNVRLLDGQQINVNTTLIPFSLIKQGCDIQKFDDPVDIDYDFFLRAGIIFDVNFHLIPQILFKYRIHSKQLSHTNILKSFEYLSNIRNEILSNLDDSKRDQYETALDEYNKKKTLTKKTMELGLQFTNNLPSWASDRILTFYLNKIRRTR